MQNERNKGKIIKVVKMDEKLNKQSIDRLDISNNCIELLKINSIKTIGELCKKSKTDLKKLSLVQEEVNKIDIELQLLGLKLKNSL